MKTSHIAIVAVAAAVGYYLYRKGSEVHATAGTSGGVVPTLRAGVRQVYTTMTASAPSSGSTEAATAGSPQFAGTDPRVSQQYPTHTTFRMNSILSAQRPMTEADLAGSGLAV